MKTINKILTSLFVLCLFLGFTACVDEVGYTPAGIPENAQVYFPNTLPAKLELSQDLTVTSFDIEIRRIDKTNALTIDLTVENENPDIFTIPTEVVFDAGSEVAILTITYDPSKLDYDEYLPISIAVSDESLTSTYGRFVYAFTAGIPAPWESLGMATYTDDFASVFFGIQRTPYKIEIQENMVTRGLYRLVNPYGKDYPFNEPGDWDESQNYYLEINAVDPEGVYIPYPQYSGMDWGYGEFIMSSLAGLRISRGTSTLEEEKAAGNCGTFANGVITFPVDALVVGMAKYPASNPGAMYLANNNGWFQVVMPGVVLADYSAEIKYTGRFTDAAEKDYAVANITLGKDVEYAKVALISGNMTEEALEGIVDGSIESEQISASGSVQFPCATSGRYTYIAVTYADDDAKDYEYVSFNFTASKTVIFGIDDFYGDYNLTGPCLSMFGAYPDADMFVGLEAGDAPNTIDITGIDLAEKVKATFDAAKGIMSIAPQPLADFYDDYYEETVTNVALQTMVPDEEDFSTTDAMTFTRIESGELLLTSSSVAIGYIIIGDDEDGTTWAYDGYEDLVFSPLASAIGDFKSSVKKSAKRISLKDFKKAAFNNANKGKSSEKTFVIKKKGAVNKTLKKQQKLAAFF